MALKQRCDGGGGFFVTLCWMFAVAGAAVFAFVAVFRRRDSTDNRSDNRSDKSDGQSFL